MDDSLDLIRDPRVYEVSYLFLPTLHEEDALSQHTALRDMVAKLEGEFISESTAELIDLAYPMYKIIDNKRTGFHTAYFGWVKFALTPEKIATIKDACDANLSLLRYLLITTLREDTVTKKRVMASSTREKRSDEDGVEVVETPAPAPVNEEQLTVAIDDIVAEA